VGKIDEGISRFYLIGLLSVGHIEDKCVGDQKKFNIYARISKNDIEFILNNLNFTDPEGNGVTLYELNGINRFGQAN